MSIRSPAKSPSFSGEINDRIVSADQDDPDAPLPFGEQQQGCERIQNHGEYIYRCPSDAEEQAPLADSEPRPINDDQDDAAIAAARPLRAWHASWLRNKGMALVLLAQMFGASMNVMTQILEIHSAMHPFQVLFARMSITAVASYLYMWWTAVPSPLGDRPVRPLLLLRAATGFMGVYGLYYSVQYLPLSEATVITFLAPIMTCYACSLLIPGETFSRRQQLAAIISLGGVILIARPFTSREPHVQSAPTAAAAWAMSLSAGRDTPSDADSYHHVIATIVAFVGVIGAAGAYTSIRMIGRRAHPLVSVTYFSSVTTVISFVAMATLPWVPFRMPSAGIEWVLLTGLGVCGFLLQFLLTAGLSYVPPASVSRGSSGQGSKATSMVYLQMVFALFYDKVIWGSTLSPISWAGSALILACAIYVAVAQDKAPRLESPARDAYRDGDGGYKDATDEA